MILVTGAGGHLGANMVRRLLADGLPVRAMLHTARDRPSVEGLPVESVVGDLRDAAFAAASARGCRQIYHCAAKVSTTYRNKDDIFAANVLGTRNILNAARSAAVEKVVVTGSFSAVGIRSDRPSNEDEPFNPLEPHLPYGFTKAAVEHECLKAFAEGLPVVVAVSTAILGPYDFKPSRMGQVLIRFASGRLRAYVPGGFPFVAAPISSKGTSSPCRRADRGSNTFLQRRIHDVRRTDADFCVGRRAAAAARSHSARTMVVAAGIAGKLLPYVRPESEQLLTPAAIRILRLGRQADIGKAQRELGFRPTDIESAIQAAYNWFVARGVIQAPSEPAAARSMEVWR